MPKLSIVTICYNSENTIRKTVESVLCQKNRNCEYIIIDGGSTDRTLDIIKEYDGIDKLISEKDNGISDAFNKGIRISNGEIIGLINSDDWYEKDVFDTIIDVFEDNKDIGFIFGDMNYVDYVGNVKYTVKGDAKYSNKIDYDMPAISHPTVFVRKEVYVKYGGFDCALRTAMDYELLLRFHKNKVKGKYIPILIANMRFGGESDINFINGYKEVIESANRYGKSKCFLYTYFCFKFIKTCVRRLLEKMGLVRIVMIIRKKMYSSSITYR